MNCSVQIVFYNGMSGHPAISYAGQFLMGAADEDFAPGIKDIELFAHVASTNCNQSLHAMWQRFEERVDTLPLALIKRRESLIEVAFRSKLGTEEQLVGDNRLPSTATMFADACAEVIEVLTFASDILKNAKGVDWAKLLRHVNQRLDCVPSNDGELKTVLDALHAEEQQQLLP